jgi:hypothetical protein
MLKLKKMNLPYVTIQPSAGDELALKPMDSGEKDHSPDA